MLSRMARPGVVREWLVGLCAYALLIAPVGCEFQSLLDLAATAGLDTNSTGFFVNEDSSSSLLVAGRGSGGDTFFVYGTRDAAGGIAEVESIHVETADGSSAYVLFELGRPVYARGPDGSYVTVSYEQVDSLHLTATVTLHDASSGAEETYQVDIDLARTAAQVATLIQQATGISVEAPVIPESGTSKLVAAGAPAGRGKVPEQRALGFWATAALVGLFALPVALAVEASTLLMGQVMASMFTVVSAAMQATLLLIVSPILLLSSLLNGVIIEIEVARLPEVFITLPGPPTIILD